MLQTLSGNELKESVLGIIENPWYWHDEGGDRMRTYSSSANKWFEIAQIEGAYVWNFGALSDQTPSKTSERRFATEAEAAADLKAHFEAMEPAAIFI